MTTNWTAKNPKALLKWACFFVLFFGSSAVASVEFRLSCKVLDNIVVEAEEGRPKRFTGYTDQFVVGDTLNFSVILGLGNSLTFSLKDTLRDNVHTFNFFSTDVMQYWDKGDYLSTVSTSFHQFGIERGDEIKFEGVQNEQLILRRYYRDDWQGAFTSLIGMKVQVAVLDCRVSGQNNLAEITDRLKYIVKKWGE